MNFGSAVLAAIAIGAAPTPSPTPDPCGSGRHTALLAALNRPTVGYSACAVKPRETVFELGYASQSGSAANVQLPQGFVRYGALPNLEVDLIGPAYEIERGGSRGFLDSGIGAKWEFTHGRSDVAGIDVLDVFPTGAAAFSAGAASQSFNLDYSRALSGIFSVGTTLGFERTRGTALDGTARRYQLLVPSLVVTDQFNARAQFYAEAFGQTATRPEGGALFGLDGGAQYLVFPQLEFDVEAGRTITDIARNHFYGLGFGVRW